MKITLFSLNNFAPEKFFGGGQIRVDERSKILECDSIMKAFFVEYNHINSVLHEKGLVRLANFSTFFQPMHMTTDHAFLARVSTISYDKVKSKR